MSEFLAEVLDKTVEVLERDGWCQGAFESARGERCAVGAIRRAARELQGASLRTVGARAAFAKYIGVGTLDVVEWNDTKGRTAAEVIDALKHTAKKLRNEAVPS
jgi:hypothetical protein